MKGDGEVIDGKVLARFYPKREDSRPEGSSGREGKASETGRGPTSAKTVIIQSPLDFEISNNELEPRDTYTSSFSFPASPCMLSLLQP